MKIAVPYRKTVLRLLSALLAVLVLASLGFAGPAVVTDSLGRQVAVPDKVERIACMYAFTGHVVAMLGKADRIIAVSNGLKRDVLFTSMYPTISQALVPKFQGAVNIEELAKAKPDIVFLAPENGGAAGEGARMDACGLTWVAVGFHSMDQQQQAVSMIGTVIGVGDKAAAYNHYYQSCIERTRRAVSALPAEHRVRVYHTTIEPSRTSSAGSLSADWLEVTGVINVAAQLPRGLLDGTHQVSIEQILLWNPEVIVANEPGVPDAIRKDPQWAAVAAVKQGRVFQMPIGISRWGHPGSLETPLAILWTAQSVYPNLFRDLDMRHEVKYFYDTFFGFTLSDQMVDQILHGQGMRLTKDRKKHQK